MRLPDILGDAELDLFAGNGQNQRAEHPVPHRQKAAEILVPVAPCPTVM